MKKCNPSVTFPATALLVLAMSMGCATPRHQTRLHGVLEQEIGRKNVPLRDYRCTMGAHRGASAEHRENTLAALMAADADPKYAFVEFDVQYSKDDRIVVFHDIRMLRMFGNFRSIGLTRYDDLVKLSRGEIVAYHDVMDRLTKRLNIEIKSQGDPVRDQRLADEVIADLKERKRDKDVLISSISGEVITYIKERYPELTTGQIFWLTTSTYLHFDPLTERLYERFNSTRADYLMLHVSNLRNIDDLLRFKPKDKTVVFWDFDDKMYIVHKNSSDRLWGESTFVSWWRHQAYSVRSIFR